MELRRARLGPPQAAAFIPVPAFACVSHLFLDHGFSQGALDAGIPWAGMSVLPLKAV